MKLNQSLKNLPVAMAVASLAAGLSFCASAVAADAESKVGSVLTGSKRSQHFDAVCKHLDLGGAMYGYMDVDGDVEKLAEVLQGFFDTIKEEAGDEMPPHIKSLKLAKVLEELGLDGVEAMGMSSIKKGDLYHNKGYLHVPGGRKGLLKILGGDAKPFVAKTLAPEDSDLIIEQSLDIRAGFEVVNAMVLRFGGPEASQQFESSVGEVVPQMGVSIGEILGKLDTRLTMVARVHPDKPLEIPDAPMEIPSFDFLIALDDTGWLFDKIIAQGKEQVPPAQQAEMFAKGDGFEKMMMPPMPSPDMAIMQPVVYHDHASKRVLIASTQAFLDECLAGKSTIASSAAFKDAMQGLPAEGNGLSYVSADLVKQYRKLLQGAVQNSPMGAAEVAITKLLDVAMPTVGNASQASVLVNTPEGILTASNTASSYKEASVMGTVAFFAGMGTAFWKSSGSVRIEEEFQFEEELRAVPDAVAEPVPVPVPEE